jgi:hypothetical protein
VVFTDLEQVEVAKSLHKNANARPRRSDHIRQFFM